MLNIQNLRTGYQHKYVLTVHDLTIPAGARCLLFGPSGSGKTTLLYTLAGLATYMEGQVTVGGQDIYSLTEAERDKWRGQAIGIIFQELHLLKPLSVLQNVVLGGFVQGEKQKTADALALLEKLGIAGLAHTSAARISRGQAQRVAIARALYQKPEILLADEPTSSLDRVSAIQVIDLLKQVSDEMGMTLIVSSHDDRIANAFDQQYAVEGTV